MSADVLRRAASLMRERAEADLITRGPWSFAGVSGQGFAIHRGEHDTVALYANRPDAEHIASWHPAVALAVAKVLDAAAETDECARELGGRGLADDHPALAVARAYLGADA